MYYIAKALEFLGLLTIFFGFISQLPGLIRISDVIYGLVLFSIGWVIEKYILK